MNIRIKKLFFFSLFLIGQILVSGQSKVYTDLTLPSKAMNSTQSYSIYLPQGYETSQRSYPVLYLLHGYGDDHKAWTIFGQMQKITDHAIASMQAAEMIVVMPDGHNDWYRNDFQGKVKMEDYLIQELIPEVEKRYRCESKKELRAIAGLSMGGYGAFVLSMKHPELFSGCCVLSGALFTLDGMNQWNKRRSLPPFSEKEQAYYQDNYDVVVLSQRYAKEIEKNPDKRVNLYFDCGDDDFLWKENMVLFETLKEKNIPFEFRMRDGAHTWQYWRECLPAVLSVVSNPFLRKR